MEINKEVLKRTIASLNYKWFDDVPNIIGIRTKLQVPDVFNDLLFVVYPQAGQELTRCYSITADPGVFYQKKLLNPQGCAIIEPGQWVDAYSLGFHKRHDGTRINPKTNKPYPAHRALVLTGHIKIKRDKDRDGIAGNSGVVMDGDNTGCNIHGASRSDVTRKIGPWSAGCQVFAAWRDKEEFIDILEPFREYTKNKFTYTLLTEDQLQF